MKTIWAFLQNQYDKLSLSGIFGLLSGEYIQFFLVLIFSYFCFFGLDLSIWIAFFVIFLNFFYIGLNIEYRCPVNGIKAFYMAVSYTPLRAHETDSSLVCRLLLEKK